MGQKHSAYIRAKKIIEEFDNIDLLIDIGVGQLFSEAWAFLERYPKCEIWGFEPQPVRFEKLKNQYPGKLLESAVSDKNGIIIGSIASSASDGFTILATPPKEGVFEFAGNIWTNHEYSSITLDSLPTESFSNIFLWADAEGSELLILKGGTSLLKSSKIVGINLEVRLKEIVVRDNYCPGFWCSYEELCDFLKEFDYFTKENFTSRRNQDILWTKSIR